jgi:hypothetical protein
MTPLRLLHLVSTALLAVRLFAAASVGFGDAEALYATYALFPQPAYVDHPGLIGSLARILGGGGAPSPFVAHLFTSVAATAVPYVGLFAARLLGAKRENAALAGLGLVAAPEISVGLFGLTPDLPLSILWLLATGLFGHALRDDTDMTRRIFSFVLAGAAGGLAVLSKISAVLLPLSAVAVFVAHPPARRTLRTAGPYLGAAMFSLLLLPLLAYEAQHGFPMVRHRLFDTQGSAGFSVRNLLALAGGQLAYVSPVVLAGAFLLGRDLVRGPRDAVRSWLFAQLWTTGVALSILCLWSRVAEPHWLAPAYLGLPLHLACVGTFPTTARVGRWALGSGLALAALLHVYVLTDAGPRFLGGAYDGRYDLANDMLFFPEALPAIARGRAEIAAQQGDVPVLCAAHWTLAAQLKAALGPGAPIATPPGRHDDFQRWMPPEQWETHPVVVWVTDERFPTPAAPSLAGRRLVEARAIPLSRAGRVVRTLRLETWVLRSPGVALGE